MLGAGCWVLVLLVLLLVLSGALCPNKWFFSLVCVWVCWCCCWLGCPVDSESPCGAGQSAV